MTNSFLQMSYMSVDLFVPTPGTVSPVLLHFYTRSERWCPGRFEFSVLNRWDGGSLIKSYWRLQTWVTKYWTMWTSDKIFLDKNPADETWISSPTSNQEAICSCYTWGKGGKSSFPQLCDTACQPFSRASRMARSSWGIQTYSMFPFLRLW